MVARVLSARRSARRSSLRGLGRGLVHPDRADRRRTGRRHAGRAARDLRRPARGGRALSDGRPRSRPVRRSLALIGARVGETVDRRAGRRALLPATPAVPVLQVTWSERSTRCRSNDDYWVGPRRTSRPSTRTCPRGLGDPRTADPIFVGPVPPSGRPHVVRRGRAVRAADIRPLPGRRSPPRSAGSPSRAAGTPYDGVEPPASVDPGRRGARLVRIAAPLAVDAAGAAELVPRASGSVGHRGAAPSWGWRSCGV